MFKKKTELSRYMDKNKKPKKLDHGESSFNSTVNMRPE